MRNHYIYGLLRKVGFLFFLFVLILYTGCIASKRGNEGSPVNLSDFSTHLDTLNTRYDLTETLTTTKMMVTIQEGDNAQEELREFLYYKKATNGDELLRIQALGAFNDTKGVAIANGNQFLLAMLDEQIVYVGKLSDGILSKIFGIDLRVSDVLSAIFANPFLDGRTKKLNITRSGEKYVITRPSIDDGYNEMITMLVDEREARVTAWYITDNDGLLHQSTIFSDYREVDGILRPFKVEIVRPLDQTKVVVKIGQVQINVNINDTKFDLETFLTDDFEIKNISANDETDVSE